MDRRWLGVEAGPHIDLARARLERVAAGQDATGVSALVGWAGGGGFESTSVTDSGGWVGADGRSE
jgi:hypothetical protein